MLQPSYSNFYSVCPWDKCFLNSLKETTGITTLLNGGNSSVLTLTVKESSLYNAFELLKIETNTAM